MDKQAEYAEAARLLKQAIAEGADEGEARAAYDAAVSAIAARPEAPATPAATEAAQPAQRPSMLDKVKNIAGGVGREALQGATMEGADEVIGAFSPEGQKTYRNDRVDFANEHPYLATGANVAGSVVGMLPVGRAAQGAGMVARAAKIASGAFGQGAVTGALAADGEGDSRLGGAAAGGIVGGAVGKLGGAVAGKVGQAITRRLDGGTGANMAERRATSLFTSGIEDTQVNPSTLPQIAGSNKGVDARMVDVLGDPGERMLRSLSTLGGKGGEKAKNFVAKRLRTYQDRLGGAVERQVQKQNVPKTVEAFNKQRKAVSDPLYEAFRKEPPMTSDRLDELFELPQFKRALNIAEELRLGKPEKLRYVNTGKVDAKGNPVLQRAYTPEFLDNVKKALDDMIYKGRQAGEGGVGPAQLKAMKDKRTEFVDILDKSYKDTYASARQAWSGVTQTKEAFEDGMSVFKSRIDPDEIVELTKGMSPADLEVFQKGAASGLVGAIEDGGFKPGSTEANRFLERVQLTFGDKANEILSGIRDEVAAQRTGARVMGKSDTAERLTDIIDVIAPERENVWQTAGFNPGRAMAQFAGRLVRDRGSTGFFSPTRAALADMLLSPQDDEKVLKRIAQEVKSRKVYDGASRRVSGPLAQQTSRGFLMNREQR